MDKNSALNTALSKAIQALTHVQIVIAQDIKHHTEALDDSNEEFIFEIETPPLLMLEDDVNQLLEEAHTAFNQYVNNCT